MLEYHTIMVHEGVEVNIQIFLALAPDSNKCQLHNPSCLASQTEPLVPHQMGG